MNRSSKRQLVIASSNAGKIKEFEQMFALSFEIIPLSKSGFVGEIEENGTTFFENALLKAKTVFDRIGKPALADDSGLCVEALDNAPGVYSARYAGSRATSAQNNALLLKNLLGVSNRNAKFVSCIVLYFGDGNYIVGNGETYGHILETPEGTQGFGYDPLFFSKELQKSFGIAVADEKNAISHRGKALAELKQKIKSWQ